MKQTKKAVSLFLTVVFSVISVCVPLGAAAADTYTVEKKDTLTRFVPATKSFAANETKTFDFTPDATAEYALFMDSVDSAKANTTTTFTITEKSSGTAVPFKVREKDSDPAKMISQDSYNYVHPLNYSNPAGYQYEKVGNISELKVALTANTEYTLSVSREAALATFNFVELKCLTLPITGGKQAIASEDASVFTTTTPAHVNEQLNYGNSDIPAGYTLIGDYTDKTSIPSSSRSQPRYIHISNGCYAEYKLDVQKAGWYRIYYNTKTWVNKDTVQTGNRYSFTIPFSVDGVEKETLVWTFTATEDKQNPAAQLLKAAPVELTEGSHTIKFGPPTNGSYAYHILLEELPDYDPSEDTVVTMDTVPVKVDNALSRFELAAPITLSSTGKSYAFTFTPATTGEYAVFFENNTSAKQPLTIAVSEAEGDKVFDVTKTTHGNPYERFGDNTYQAVSLEAGKTYTITLSGGGTDIKMNYFDLRCVNPLPIPSEGKFAISPSDYVATTIGGSHMSQQFNSQSYKNTEYPMVGDYFSSELAAPRDRVTAVHHGNGASITYALNVTASGMFTLKLPSVTTYPGDAKAESIRLSVNGEVYDEQGWTGSATDLTFKPFYLGLGVNRITLTNLTVPYDDKDGTSVGSYLKSLLFDQVQSAPEPTEISGDTKVDSKIPLSNMTAAEGSVIRGTDGSYSFKAGSAVTYKVNVAEKGTYVVYIDGKAAQNGADILVDGASKLGWTYKATGQKETVNASFSTRQVKKLSVPVDLEPGEHTLQFQFVNGTKWDNEADKPVDITDADNYTSNVYSAWMRRVDLTASADEEMFLRSWDFSEASMVNETTGVNSTGWLFPHQYGQGGPFTVGSFTDCRSVVFINSASTTYKVNIPKSGLYNFSTYINNSAATNTYTMTVDGKNYSCDVTTDGNGPTKSTFAPVYLAAGTYNVKFTSPAKPNGTLRLYGVSVAKQAGDFVAVGTDSASVDVTFDKAYTGKVITAFYSADKELVGVKVDSVTDAANYSADVTLSGTPTKAKVLVWNDLTNIVPLKTSINFTAGSTNWITK